MIATRPDPVRTLVRCRLQQEQSKAMLGKVNKDEV